jgi:hypothetical protein
MVFLLMARLEQFVCFSIRLALAFLRLLRHISTILPLSLNKQLYTSENAVKLSDKPSPLFDPLTPTLSRRERGQVLAYSRALT